MHWVKALNKPLGNAF